MTDLMDLLRHHAIKPTPQRLAVVKCLQQLTGHPTADEVLAHVRAVWPSVARATVYNTLNLFVDKGLIRRQTIREGISVYDSVTQPHHHFVDADSGDIVDLPHGMLTVQGIEDLKGFEIVDVSVLVRGRRKTNLDKV